MQRLVLDAPIALALTERVDRAGAPAAIGKLADDKRVELCLSANQLASLARGSSPETRAALSRLTVLRTSSRAELESAVFQADPDGFLAVRTAEDYGALFITTDPRFHALSPAAMTPEDAVVRLDARVERVPYFDMRSINLRQAPELEETLLRVLRSGWFILGKEAEAFEAEYAAFTGTRHCVGVSNALDGLTLILRAYRELGRLAAGDRVIVPSNTYIATILSIVQAGLEPVLVEPDEATCNLDPALIEAACGARTRAVMPVHLYGQCADMDRIRAAAEKHGLLVIEDAAQSHGARFGGRRAGSLSHAGAVSFFPSKNMGALGDGGAVTTDDQALADCVRVLRNYGSQVKYVNKYKGYNCRLDELQAAFLRAKLPLVDADNEHRRELARVYLERITNPAVTLPVTHAKAEHVWHVFSVRTRERDRLRAHLTERGVDTMVHYPVPPHKQEAFVEWAEQSYPVSERMHREILSLPMSQVMTIAQAEYVAAAVNDFRPEAQA